LGQIVPGANRDNYLRVDEVVHVVRSLIRLGDNVQVGPQILICTMSGNLRAELPCDLR
jgi:hypothetical protein